MIKIHTPPFNRGLLAEKVRQGIERGSARGVIDSANPSSRDTSLGTPSESFHDRDTLVLQPSFTPRKDNSYHVNELLQYHDKSFIQNAYLAILKRGPDASGYTAFMEALQAGRLNKIDILARLRYAAEGRAKKTEIKGLLIPAALRVFYRVPIIGYLLNLFVALARLPSNIRNQQRFEAYVLSRNELIAQHLNATNKRTWQNMETVKNEIKELRNLQSELKLLIESSSRDSAQVLADRTKTLTAAIDRVASDERQIRAEMVLQAIQVRNLLDQANALTEGKISSNPVEVISEERAHILDGFYLSLENRFRGTRREVTDRCRVYLPFVFEAGVGTADKPVLDIACGRGEWLELLKSEGLHGRGVDLNRAFVAHCLSAGLDVVEGEILEYLKSLPAESIGAITGFHIVEHLPLDVLVQLLDETSRILRPGGIVIFETPNPENVIVGSCNFYLDPTHRNPLPSQVLSLLVESKGFAQVDVLKLNPSDAEAVTGDSDLIKRFNELFYGPMDYAVIGVKQS